MKGLRLQPGLLALAAFAGILLSSNGCHGVQSRRLYPSGCTSSISNSNIPQKNILKQRRDNPLSDPQATQQLQLSSGTAPISRGGGASGKFSSLKERTISAVLMLAGLVLWIDTFREKGLIVLVLIVQMGLYREGTNIVLSNKELKDGKPNKKTASIKWWWFAAYNMALVGPRILERKRDGSPLLSANSIYMCSFGMVCFGIISFVLALNASIAFSYEFQLALQELASYHLAIFLLIVPSSFWISTIQDFGMNWVLYSLYIVMINDTMAYIFGAGFGKHPLLPTISPKKTWEGFLGALVSTMGLSVLLWQAMHLEGGIIHALVIAAYCSLVAPFGGFLASIVKRAYGKKDFSNLIAGHGGFIDRLDCQIITAPFIYLYLRRFVQPWKP